MPMCTTHVVVDSEVGLHARAATAFVQSASLFRSSIWAEYQGIRTSAKNLLGVLSLGVDRGAEIILTASGEDENAALDALRQVVSATA